MARNIIVATDFSSRALAALKQAAHIAATADTVSDLTVLHAINRTLFERFFGDGAEDKMVSSAKQRLQKIIGELGIEAKTTVVIGEPYVAIGQITNEQGANLVIVGDHGEFRLRDLLLGTTTKKLIEHLTVPILVIKTKLTHDYSRILLATDFSEHSRKAIMCACALFPNAKYTIFNAYLAPNDIVSGYYGIAASATEPMLASMHVEADTQVKEFIKTLPIDADKFKPIVRAGVSPIEDILDICEQEHSDLLVVGTKGVESPMSMMIGSTAESLLRHSPIDMLVLKA
jgi:nucleotide-binding universal stress UspA family protein